MPTYDYQCRACGAVTEVIHSMLEPGPSACERCGGELRRILYPTGIIFKGSGFYKTDSRAGSNGPAPAKAPTGGSGGEGAGSGSGETTSTSSGDGGTATRDAAST